MNVAIQNHSRFKVHEERGGGGWLKKKKVRDEAPFTSRKKCRYSLTPTAGEPRQAKRQDPPKSKMLL
jgi:hypothetical protein